MRPDLNQDDPFGYRLDLQDAIQAVRENPNQVDAAADLLLAYGRCLVFGVDPNVELRDIAPAILPPAVLPPAVVDKLIRNVRAGVQTARALPSNWDATPDPWDADELCVGLIELRTDFWGVELAIGELGAIPQELRAALRDFDDAMRAAETVAVLATLVEADDYQNFRALLGPAHAAAPPWWLGAELEQVAKTTYAEALASMPPPSYWQRARVATAWSQRFPKLVEETGALAADVERERGVIQPRAWTWQSPDGKHTAQLNWRPQVTSPQDAEPLPLLFLRADGEISLALDGQPIRLGAFHDVIRGGKAELTLGQLRRKCDGRLFVGEPPVEWPTRWDAEDDPDAEDDASAGEPTGADKDAYDAEDAAAGEAGLGDASPPQNHP